MIGAIIGDIVGSIYEFANHKSKDFPFFQSGMEATDDSVLSVATADWLLNGGRVGDYYRRYASRFPHPLGGYGASFEQWVRSGSQRPYNSCGNGSAMRVGPVGWAFSSEPEVLSAARVSAECTHNHPEGIKGAQATSLCIFLARQGALAADIKARVESDFGYDLSLSVDAIRPRYSWHGLDMKVSGATCQGSVPQALVCALDAADFEDAVRNAVSIGGDSDTIGCIAGAVAEALFGVPASIAQRGMGFLPASLRRVVEEFEYKHGCNIV